MEETITSLQNARVKHLVALQQKSALRREEGVFVVEGIGEIKHCIACGYKVRQLYKCIEILANASGEDTEEAIIVIEQMQEEDNTQIFNVSPAVYAKIAYRETTEGVMAVVEDRPMQLTDLKLPENPLIVVLESVEKPGNLGAVLRSADAAAADAVIVCDPKTDLRNPNLIRASLGAIFSVPCVACTSEECIAYLKGKGIRILTAQLQDSHLYYHTDMKCGTAIVMGTESTGLTQQWRAAADAHIRIPMLGHMDSLNVSVSAAILLFEAVRQRQE